MKKILIIGTALALVSTAAMASQARLLALGMNETDNEGVYHISDSRNIFLNPAYINLYPNQVEFDWGSVGQYASAGGVTSATLNNNTSSPKAQGGVFKKYGDFVYGLYLGNESNTSSLLRVAGTSAIAVMNGTTTLPNTGTASKMLATSDNQVDLFFGGDNGLKWAVNPVITMGKDDARKSKDSGYSVRGGVIGSGWDAHLNLSLGSKSEATDSVTATALGVVTATDVYQEFKGKIGFHVGGSYVLSGNNRVFGYVKHYGWEQTDGFTYSAGQQAGIGGQNGTVKGDFTSYYLGWGSEYDVNTTDKLFASFAAKKTDINLKFSNKSEVRHLVIPLTIGYEAQATGWLTLRGSVVQNIYGNKNNTNIDNYGATGTRVNKVGSTLIKNIYGSTGKGTIANSTAVNAGATLAFGQLSVDGLLSTTSSAGAASTKTGILSLANLETSVGVTYKF
jgi:hypothetical protein